MQNQDCGSCGGFTLAYLIMGKYGVKVSFYGLKGEVGGTAIASSGNLLIEWPNHLNNRIKDRF